MPLVASTRHFEKAIPTVRTSPFISRIASLLRSQLLWPFVGAAALFGLNNGGIISGWLRPPAGFASTRLFRADDVAQYFTWIEGLKNQIVIPDYHAPWITEPALSHPIFLVLARTSNLLNLDVISVYHLLHFLFYVVAAYSLYFAMRVFLKTPKQMLLSLALLICVVPLTSLLVLPYSVASGQLSMSGQRDFFLWSSDGFLHGISGSILVTFGTATTLLAFGLLARFIKTEKRKYLGFAAGTIFISAVGHPFEFIVITCAAVSTLVLLRWFQWRRLILEVAVIGAAGAFGVLPLMVMIWRSQWMQDAVTLNRWNPGSIRSLVIMLGLPAVVASLLLILKPRLSEPTDKLLQCWFIVSLVGLYVPWIPWSQHLLDGFHYVTAMLLARQLTQFQPIQRLWRSYSPAMAGGLLVLCFLSVSAYAAYYAQSFRDGKDGYPEWFFTTLAPVAELEALAWMHKNSSDNDLVLAPRSSSPWFATVPMHSFASHPIFGVTFKQQKQLSDSFYKGELQPGEAKQLLNDYGIRFVVVNQKSPAVSYMADSKVVANFGDLNIYEIPGNQMKAYAKLALR